MLMQSVAMTSVEECIVDRYMIWDLPCYGFNLTVSN